MRVRPDPAVMAWLNHNAPELALPSVTIAEVAFGIEKIRPAERAPRLAKALRSVRQHYAERIYSFDEEAALLYGAIMGEAFRTGRGLSTPDGMIAAIVLRHNATLATRNAKDFAFLNLEVVNPWD